MGNASTSRQSRGHNAPGNISDLQACGLLTTAAGECRSTTSTANWCNCCMQEKDQLLRLSTKVSSSTERGWEGSCPLSGSASSTFAAEWKRTLSSLPPTVSTAELWLQGAEYLNISFYGVLLHGIPAASLEEMVGFSSITAHTHKVGITYGIKCCKMPDGKKKLYTNNRRLYQGLQYESLLATWAKRRQQSSVEEVVQRKKYYPKDSCVLSKRTLDFTGQTSAEGRNSMQPSYRPALE